MPGLSGDRSAVRRRLVDGWCGVELELELELPPGRGLAMRAPHTYSQPWFISSKVFLNSATVSVTLNLTCMEH